MNDHTKLSALLDLVQSVGLQVRSAPVSDDYSAGALVSLKGRDVLFLNTSASPIDQIDVVVAALRGRSELESVYLPPALRELIDLVDG